MNGVSLSYFKGWRCDILLQNILFSQYSMNTLGTNMLWKNFPCWRPSKIDIIQEQWGRIAARHASRLQHEEAVRAFEQKRLQREPGAPGVGRKRSNVALEPDLCNNTVLKKGGWSTKIYETFGNLLLWAVRLRLLAELHSPNMLQNTWSCPYHFSPSAFSWHCQILKWSCHCCRQRGYSIL